MYKHRALRCLNTNISTSPLLQACLHNGKFRVKCRNEEVLSDSLADFVFLHITPFWKENQHGDWWVSLAEELSCWEVGMAVVQAEACRLASSTRGPLRTSGHTPLLRNPLYFYLFALFLARKTMSIAYACPESLPLSPSLHVCVWECASTHAFVNPFTLELVFGSCTSPSEEALLGFSRTQQSAWPFLKLWTYLSSGLISSSEPYDQVFELGFQRSCASRCVRLWTWLR